MSTFIVEDDIWGIRRAVREIYNKVPRNRAIDGVWHTVLDAQIEFDAFYNQQLPDAWKETLSTVNRHYEDILELAEKVKGLVWFKRNGQFNSGYLNNQFIQSIKNKEVELPTYIEIEEEKQRWQSHPQYNKERGFSEPIREELIQIKIHK